MALKINRKRALKFIALIALGGVLLVSIAFAIIYKKQDELVQNALSDFNEGIIGEIEFKDSHISLFENFPYVSIDLDDVNIYDSKRRRRIPIVHLEDIYVGFDIWSILNGDYTVKKIKLSNGGLQIVQNNDNSINLIKALESKNEEPSEDTDEALNPTDIKLESIELENIDLLKLNRANHMLFEVYFDKVQSNFSIKGDQVNVSLDSDFLFNLIIKGDTTFLHDKHLSLNTDINYDLDDEFVTLSEAELIIEKAEFNTKGTIDIKNDLFLDLQFSGKKPNFDLFLAFAPEELDPVLSRYDNGGDVYFNANLLGPATFGKSPHIDVEFGCEEAFVNNTVVDKGVNELFFKGHYTNGKENSAATSEFVIEEIRAKPETGTFQGAVSVTNFNSPDIEMQVNSEFNLDFLIDFLGLEDLQDVSGNVALKMNFHDIIDLDDPTKTIESFNESYFTELKVENFNFRSPDFHLPISDLNINAYMDGHQANIENLSFKAGNSDLKINASISDLPAIIHHTNIPVDVDLKIKSDLIDIFELTSPTAESVGFNEKLSDLSLGFKFKSSAKAFTESPNLPLGEFFIDELTAKFQNYPHALHDFNADVIIDSVDMRVIDFKGFIDQSDFHFNGALENYDLWFEEKPIGETQINFDLTAARLQLHDLFSYNGENYVPEDYRNEEFDDVKIHGFSQLTFNDKLKSVNLQIDKIEAYMKEHDMRFEQFSGLFKVDSTRLRIKDLQGKLGNTQIDTDLTYYFDAKERERTHKFSLKSPRLDFDQLFSYIPEDQENDTVQVDHEAGFNVFDLPFSNLKFKVDIDHLNYHKYLLDDFKFRGRVQEDHFIYVDTLSLYSAGGAMRLNGYFNGSDPDHIYFSPNLTLEHIDLDKLLFKFDNFGQDQLISENLHGELTGNVTGKIRMHPDLVPMIDDSQLTMDIEVVNGSLVDFTAFEALADFFTDKNLALVRFDTLKNELKLENGDLIIPNMNINTTLGYFEIAGKQGFDLDMEYAMRIPVKVATRAGFQKLFAKKGKDNSGNVDEIEYRDFKRRTRFINVLITGTPDDYDVSIGKSKE